MDLIRNTSRGREKQDWRRQHPEPPAQRINSYMLEDPMYEYMEEKKKREKHERIAQLKALLESSTDSSSSSSSSNSSGRRKKKKKHRKKQNNKGKSKRKKREFSSADEDGQEYVHKKKLRKQEISPDKLTLHEGDYLPKRNLEAQAESYAHNSSPNKSQVVIGIKQKSQHKSETSRRKHKKDHKKKRKKHKKDI